MSEARVRVLLVEDEPGYVRLVQEMLDEEKMGYSLLSVGDLSSALEAVRVGEFDVVLLDLGLPDSRHLDTFRGMYAGAPGTAIIVSTALDDSEAAVEAVKLGAQDYLVKGQTEASELVRSIRYAIERKRMEMELQMRAYLLDAATDSIVLRDLGGNFIYVNEAAYRTRGYSRDEFMKLKPSRLLTIDGVRRLEEWDKGLMEKGEAIMETTHVRKDGSHMPVEVQARVIELDGKKLALGVIRDITMRKKMEEEVREAEERYREVVDNSNDGIVAISLDGVITFSNRRMLEMAGYGAGEVVGRSFSDLIKVDAKRRMVELLQSATMREVTGLSEFELTRGDGSTLYVEASAAAIRRGGALAGVQVICRDIGRRKAGERRIRVLAYQLNGLKPGGCFISDSHERCFKAFADLTMQGVPGLCLAREDPEALVSQYGLGRESIVLLSTRPVSG